MKILLCGEGPHDMGCIEPWSIRADRQRISPGWLQPLLNRILGDNLEFLLVPRNRLVALPSKHPPKGGYPAGHGRKAMAAKLRAHVEKCDLLVFMVDADSTDERVWEQRRSEIQAGFDLIPGIVKAVACVPMSTSESWLLADAQAWQALGLNNPNTLPPKPEQLWGGRSDPLGNHPHCVFARACGAAGQADDREIRVEIMRIADFDVVRRVCPMSFVQFCNDLAA